MPKINGFLETASATLGQQSRRLFSRSKSYPIATLLAGLFMVVIVLTIAQIGNAVAGGGILIYSDNTTTPQKRDWTSGGSAFGSEGSTLVSNDSRQVVVKVSPVANREQVMGTLSSAGVLQVSRSMDGGAHWVADLTISLGGTGTTRRFDIAFEQSSGDIVVAYSKNATTNEIGVRRFNGSWQAETTADPGGTSTVVSWVELAEKAGSDELALGYVTIAGSGNNIGVGIWNGSTNALGNWTAALGMCDQTAVTPVGADKCMDVNYETSSGFPVMSWGIASAGNTTNTIRASRWNGASWTTNTLSIGATGDDGTYVDCEANPTAASNDIACGSYGASTADVQAWTVASGVLGVAGLDRDTAAHAAAAGESFVAATYVVDGANVRGIVAWADAVSTPSDNQIDYSVLNGTWGAATTTSKTFGDDENLLAVENPYNNAEAIFLISDENQDLWASKLSLSGSTLTWANADGGSALETTLGTITGRPFDFAYNPAEPLFTQSAYRWYANDDNVQPGAAKANENTASTTLKTNPLRLRAQLTASSAVLASTQSFKVQSATSTSGPWTDVQDAWCSDSTGITCTTSWGARRKVTMDNTPASENLTNFPLLVKVNSSRIDYGKTQAAGQDIRFVDPSNPGVVLPHQIELWNESGDSYIWVKVPQVDAGSPSDYLWMYYDNASIGDGQDTTNVWESNYKAVWHSQETGTTTLGDSTSNANTATKVNSTNPNPNTGKIDGAQAYDGSTSHADAVDSNSLDITGTITVSAWINAAALPGGGAYSTILIKETTINTANYGLQVVNNKVDFSWFNGAYRESFSNTNLATGTWYYVTATFEDATDQVKIYINGELDSVTTQTTSITANAQSLTIGKSLAGEWWNGTLDEMRLSANVRSASWIKAEYTNQNDTMNSFGSEQSQTGSPWGFYDNSTPANGATIGSSVLTGTDSLETYQESNPTVLNPNAISASNQGEWDFSLNPSNATTGSTYYFRMAKPDGTALTAYTVYPQILVNTIPDNPTALAQTTASNVTIATGGWNTQNSVKFTASATDPDPTDTLQLCVEKKAIGVSFSNTEDSCGTGVAYSGSAVAPTVTIGSISDGVYHWQARIKDASGDYSPWVSYGSNLESVTDFGIDTVAPSTGTVNDGLGPGDSMFNDGTLTTVSANWTGFSDATSGIASYDYAIGTTPGGTNLRNWTSAGNITAGSDNGLSLQTSQLYYISIRAVDAAGNTGSGVSSNGQYVLPTLSFGVSPGTVTFDNLNGANSYTNSKTTTLTTTTNGYGGYRARSFVSGLLTGGGSTIADFPGTYAATRDWGANTGFGFSTSDTDIAGFPLSGACSGSGTAPCFAAFTQTKPGDVVASATGPVSNDSVTITYKVVANNTQKATNYTNTIIYSVTPMY